MNLLGDSLISRLSPKSCASRICLCFFSFFVLYHRFPRQVDEFTACRENANQFPINKVTWNVATFDATECLRKLIFRRVLPLRSSTCIIERFLTAYDANPFPREFRESFFSIVSALSFFFERTSEKMRKRDRDSVKEGETQRKRERQREKMRDGIARMKNRIKTPMEKRAPHHGIS